MDDVELPSASWQNSNDSTPSKAYKSLPRNKCPSTCLVCRNPAVGYHYDTPSCNGCKTFFRRTILKGDTLKCTRRSDCFDGTTPIDMSRRVCRFCRFEKCIEMGMNPKAINFELRTEEARSLMEEVMRRRTLRGFVANAGIVTHEERINKIVNKLSLVECKIDKVHTEGIPKGFDDRRKLEDVLRSKPMFSNTEIPNLIKVENYTRSNTLQYAHCSFLASLEYSKTFEFSRQLDLEEKMILVRHVTAACSNLLNAFFTISHFRSDRLMLPDGTEAGANMKELEQILHLDRDGVQKTLRMLLRNRIDRVEYMLLKAIVMCNPAVAGLSDRTQRLLESERQNYAFCLLRYCRLQHSALNGPARYAGLLSMVPSLELEVRRQKDFHVYIKAITSEMKLRDHLAVSPLFNEILDS